jgi:hypothetical protein
MGALGSPLVVPVAATPVEGAVGEGAEGVCSVNNTTTPTTTATPIPTAITQVGKPLFFFSGMALRGDICVSFELGFESIIQKKKRNVKPKVVWYNWKR